MLCSMRWHAPPDRHISAGLEVYQVTDAGKSHVADMNDSLSIALIVGWLRGRTV